MKYVLLLFVLLTTFDTVSAQDVLIPYREGKKFGLSDDKGKIVLKPSHDAIHYLKGKYFNAVDSVITQDSFTSRSGMKKKETSRRVVYSLLQGNKTIISRHPFRHFFIYDHLIVGSESLPS